MRRRNRRPPYEYVIAGVLALLLLSLLFMLFNIWKKEDVARHTAEETKRELELLEVREKTLQANIAELRTERGQEASLRETYGVAKPGEEVIIVVSPPEEDELQELPWWRKFLGFLGL